MSHAKISVRIHKPLLDWFRHEVRNLPFGQDALLDHLIATETPALADDLKGLRLSSVAKRYISGELKRMGPQPVSIYVRTSTQDALKEVVEATNLVRDAFINRLLMLWRGAPPLLEWLGVPQYVEQIDQPKNGIVFRLETAPLAAVRTLLRDPFLFLREARLTMDPDAEGLYRFPLPATYAAFNCYMDDWMVPNSKAEKSLLKELGADPTALAREEQEIFGESSKGGVK